MCLFHIYKKYLQRDPFVSTLVHSTQSFSPDNQCDPTPIKPWIMSLLCLKLTYLIHSKSQKFYNSLQSPPSLWTLSLLFCSHTGFLLLSEEHIPIGRLCSGHSVCLECSPHIYTCIHSFNSILIENVIFSIRLTWIMPFQNTTHHSSGNLNLFYPP